MADTNGPTPSQLYAEARFTADISNQMQVPDRIMVSGESSPAHSNYSERDPPNSKYNDLGERENQAVALFPVCQIKSVQRIIYFF